MALHLPAAQTAPAHVAIIMDGNRRWAAARNLPAIEGHRRGVESLRQAVRGALDSGTGTLTVYGFSTENWRRDGMEVAALMHLCSAFARRERSALFGQGVRVRILGDHAAFPARTRKALDELMRATECNRRLTLQIALNYSGREEIVRALKAIAREVAGGTLDPECIDENVLRARFYEPHTPDPDLLIRTGGELRVSNFLLFQIAYTELIAVPAMWPDFTADDFAAAVETFTRRQRRFGS